MIRLILHLNVASPPSPYLLKIRKLVRSLDGGASFFISSKGDYMQGRIKLHRQIQDRPDRGAEPFTKGQARVDLILIANHCEGFFYVRGNKVIIKRGQIGRSEERLSEKRHWSRNKLRRWLKHLKTIQQIEHHTSKVLSIIEIINYDLYQGDDTTDDTTEKHQKVQQKNTNKNDKNKENEKEGKEIYLSIGGENNFPENDIPESLPSKGIKKKRKKRKSSAKREKENPTLDQVKEYFQEKGYKQDIATKAFNYYESSNRYDSKGSRVVNRKQKMIGVWFKDENKEIVKEVKPTGLSPGRQYQLEQQARELGISVDDLLLKLQ